MSINSLRLLPLSAAAQKFGVPGAWLREEALAGRLPHLKAKDRFFFEPDLLESALREMVLSCNENSNKALKGFSRVDKGEQR